MQQHILLNEIGRSKKSANSAFLSLGFRPFFLIAAVFSVLSLSLWIAVYTHGLTLHFAHNTASQWHAHEMLYGYGFAVIAGFLLTAIKNWTNIQTLQGKPLLTLTLLWATARLLMLINPRLVLWAAFFDLAFNLYLSIAVVTPIIQVKQWRQLGVLAKILILSTGNAAFYAGALGWWKNGVQISISIGLFLIISLILVISRRVLPMFIERGVSEKVTLRQFKIVDVSIMLFLVAFLLNEVLISNPTASITIGFLLFMANSFRLVHWHTKGIWSVPLLWSFYSGLWFINLGFLCVSLSYLTNAIHMIFAIHFLAIGGIGLITLAMMARVSLGHTGRNILQPHKAMSYAFGLMIISTFTRALLPIFTTQYYPLWVILAYAFWVLAFGLFAIIYYPILTEPRIDGKAG